MTEVNQKLRGLSLRGRCRFAFGLAVLILAGEEYLNCWSSVVALMMLSEQTDAEVLQALRSGNSLALGILYDRYGELVYRLALRILGNVSEAEDLTQEVFLTFWRQSTYDSKRGSMSSFLMTLTRSRAIDRLRKARSQQQILQKWQQNFSSPANSLLDQASLAELSGRVRQALQEFPDNQRQLLELAYFDGLSQSEITRKLNIPLGTVKTRSRQGLLKLRQLLKDLVES